MYDFDSFSTRYKKLSDAELLVIINNPDDYQPMASEAAHVELGNRQLNPVHVEQINMQIQATEQKKISPYSNNPVHCFINIWWQISFGWLV